MYLPGFVAFRRKNHYLISMSLKIEGIEKRYGELSVLNEVSLEVERGQLVSIVGPSGAGKTTLLKICAGLIEPDSGRIIGDLSAGEGETGNPILVFQDYLLFPYMTVFENVAFGLKARRLRKAEITRRVEEILGFFRIDDKAGEYPKRLSGGQRQRVALARALVLRPSLLLLDEPFANLDQNLKMDTALFLRRTQRSFGNLTTLCVTHDMEEACAMSDRLGVLLDGNLVDFGSPQRVFDAPHSRDSAEFLDGINPLPRRLFPLFGIESQAPFVYVMPGAFDVEFADFSESPVAEQSAESGVSGRIEKIRFTGKTYELLVDIEGNEFQMRSLDAPKGPGGRVLVSLRRYLEAGPEGVFEYLEPRGPIEEGIEEEIV
jgi:putative spermidine/putrescine transport system ATP-binding protein